MATLDEIRERARLVREDCPRDVEALERAPFDGRTVGQAFGNVIAQIGALAKCIEELTEVERVGS